MLPGRAGIQVYHIQTIYAYTIDVYRNLIALLVLRYWHLNLHARFFSWQSDEFRTGWGKRGTSEDRIIPRAKVNRKFRIHLFYASLSFRQKRLWHFIEYACNHLCSTCLAPNTLLVLASTNMLRFRPFCRRTTISSNQDTAKLFIRRNLIF